MFAEPAQNVRCQRAVVRAGFNDVNLALEIAELFCQEKGQHLSKKWPDGNAGEEVARFADMIFAIITMAWMIEREFHETRKRDVSRASDFVLNDRCHGIDVLALPSRIQ